MGVLDSTYIRTRFTIAQDGAAYLNEAPFYNDAGDDISSQLEALSGVAASDLSGLGTTPNGTHTITVGAQAGDDIAVTIQLKTRAGTNMARASVVHAYLSDSSTGVGVTGTAIDSAAAGAAGAVQAIVAGKVFLLETSATGVCNVTLTEDGTDTWYLVIISPDGSKTVSGAIAFVE